MHIKVVIKLYFDMYILELKSRAASRAEVVIVGEWFRISYYDGKNSSLIIKIGPPVVDWSKYWASRDQWLRFITGGIGRRLLPYSRTPRSDVISAFIMVFISC